MYEVQLCIFFFKFIRSSIESDVSFVEIPSSEFISSLKSVSLLHFITRERERERIKVDEVDLSRNYLRGKSPWRNVE